MQTSSCHESICLQLLVRKELHRHPAQHDRNGWVFTFENFQFAVVPRDEILFIPWNVVTYLLFIMVLVILLY